MRHIEENTQIACVRWFNLQYPEYRGLLYAVPNGGARNKVEAAKLKAEGVVAGVADLILAIPRNGFGCLCIEMKTDKGRQSESQKLWQRQTEKHGNKYVVCRDFMEFKTEIENYLKQQ